MRHARASPSCPAGPAQVGEPPRPGTAARRATRGCRPTGQAMQQWYDQRRARHDRRLRAPGSPATNFDVPQVGTSRSASEAGPDRHGVRQIAGALLGQSGGRWSTGPCMVPPVVQTRSARSAPASPRRCAPAGCPRPGRASRSPPPVRAEPAEPGWQLRRASPGSGRRRRSRGEQFVAESHRDQVAGSLEGCRSHRRRRADHRRVTGCRPGRLPPAPAPRRRRASPVPAGRGDPASARWRSPQSGPRVGAGGPSAGRDLDRGPVGQGQGHGTGQYPAPSRHGAGPRRYPSTLDVGKAGSAVSVVSGRRGSGRRLRPAGLDRSGRRCPSAA